MGDRPQGVAGDCNSLEATHAWFDSRVAHHRRSFAKQKSTPDRRLALQDAARERFEARRKRNNDGRFAKQPAKSVPVALRNRPSEIRRRTTLGPAAFHEVRHRIAPGDVFAAADAALFSSLRFSRTLQACEELSANGVQSKSEDGACAWFQAGATFLNRDGDRSSIGYQETSYGVAGGMQLQFAEDWCGWYALGYEAFNQEDDKINSGGNSFKRGVSIRPDNGATALSGSVLGGYST